jgi:hypothetical protein
MMDKNSKEILETFKEIYKSKNLVKEVSSMSPSIAGEKEISIPRSGAHAGQSGWQSANAWDIKMNIGDPVYSVADGVVKTFADYGPSVKKVNGKKLFGAGFTVDSDGGLPDVYYTHLMNPQVKKGDKIKCGQLLGYVMDFPGSSYDHLHIGVEDNNIRRFIDDKGNLFCAKGKKISSSNVGSPTKSVSNDVDFDDNIDLGKIGSLVTDLSSGGPGRFSRPDTFLASLTQSFLSGGLKESFSYGNFGRNENKSSRKVTLPSRENTYVNSPIDGIVESTNFLSCSNELSILHEIDGDEFYLTYCGISNPRVLVGDNVSKGTKLGDTNTDIIIRVFDKKGYPLSFDFVESKKPKKDKKDKKNTKEKTYSRQYSGPKRFSNPDDFVSDVIKFPFKLIGSLTKGGFKSVTEEKINENINRIKKLL